MAVVCGKPLVSVVMGAYNAAHDLATSVASVLDQEGVDLELIVVNDGSTDGTGVLLHEAAFRDARVRVINKAVNEGLTKALIDGCDTARGEFIARQDSDDRSLPGRLAVQLRSLRAHREAVLVSCGTRFIGPCGEHLYEVTRDGLELQRYLEQTDAARIQGPSCHGSVMFRRSAYQAVGGYRMAFLVAQDLDLWVRLSEIGHCLGLREILYEAAWRTDSISDSMRTLQIRARETVLESRRLRHAGTNDDDLLCEFRQAVETARRKTRGDGGCGRSRARYDYFIGSNLARRGDAGAAAYLRSSIRAWPWAWRPWVKWALVALGARRSRTR